MLLGEIFNLQWRNVIRGLQTAPSSPERMIGALKVRIPYSSWNSDHREGRGGARQSTQMPSGDLGPSPLTQWVGEPGEKPGVEKGGEERGLSQRPHPFSLLIPGKTFSSLVPSPTFCFLVFFFNWAQISQLLWGTLAGSLEQMWEVICSFSPGWDGSLEEQRTEWRLTRAPAQRRRLLSESPTLFFYWDNEENKHPDQFPARSEVLMPFKKKCYSK